MESYKAVVNLQILAPSPDGNRSEFVGGKYKRKIELPIYIPAVAGLRIWLDYQEGEEGEFLLVKEVELWPSNKLVLNCVTSDHYMPGGALDHSGSMLVPYERMLEITGMLDINDKWRYVL